MLVEQKGPAWHAHHHKQKDTRHPNCHYHRHELSFQVFVEQKEEVEGLRGRAPLLKLFIGIIMTRGFITATTIATDILVTTGFTSSMHQATVATAVDQKRRLVWQFVLFVQFPTDRLPKSRQNIYSPNS